MTEVNTEVEVEDDETEEERQARLDLELDEISQARVDAIVDRMLIVIDEFSDVTLYGYQTPFARRLVESLIIGDGATITALFSRQSGKSETVANTVAACMVMFPILAKVFPNLMGKFKKGMWVGCFAPTDEQTDIIYSRIVSRLTSTHAQAFMADPDINEKVAKGRGSEIRLANSGSFIRRQTAHPRASIEGRTYHLMVIDECQDADERVVNKSIRPMGAATNGTLVFIGTPGYHKGVFYKKIQQNKRAATKRGVRENHFEADWREVSKWNKDYAKFVRQEMLSLGEDSDEFRLSYRLHWLLDKGMFTTSERLDELGDKSMQPLVAYNRTPVVVGIDCARKMDSTVVTVVWVDWDRPDEFGKYEYRVLNWLDLTGLGWEEQYPRIVDFLSNYRVLMAGVDEGGVGDVFIARMRVLMPYIEWVPMQSDRKTQSARWKHLKELLERGKIGWPAHAKTKRLKIWKRFIQQMSDLEVKYEGPYVLAQAPKATDAHDDYADSLALACILAETFEVPEVEVSANPFYGPRR